jgi:hypothetical protein
MLKPFRQAGSRYEPQVIIVGKHQKVKWTRYRLDDSGNWVVFHSVVLTCTEGRQAIIKTLSIRTHQKKFLNQPCK